MDKFVRLLSTIFYVSIVFPVLLFFFNIQQYKLFELLPIILLLVLYLFVASGNYSKIYIFGLLTLIVGEVLQKYFNGLHGLDLVLNAICTFCYVLILINDVHKVSNKSILILTAPFIILLIFSYFYFGDSIESRGEGAVNFYVFALAFFTLLSVTTYISNKTKNNLWLIFSVITAYINAITFAYNNLANIEILFSIINVVFVLHHYFMYRHTIDRKWENTYFS